MANSSTKNRKDLRLDKVDKLLISYNITNSWLFLSSGFDFIFSLHDSENRQYHVILHTFAVLYRTLSVTSNTLSWTKASACQTVANNSTVTLTCIALLVFYAHMCQTSRLACCVIACVPVSSPFYLFFRGGSHNVKWIHQIRIEICFM